MCSSVCKTVSHKSKLDVVHNDVVLAQSAGLSQDVTQVLWLPELPDSVHSDEGVVYLRFCEYLAIPIFSQTSKYFVKKIDTKYLLCYEIKYKYIFDLFEEAYTVKWQKHNVWNMEQEMCLTLLPISK